MSDQHILVGKRLGVLVLYTKIPQLYCGSVSGVHRDGVKRLGNDGLLHGGPGVPKDVLRGLLAPVHFLIGVFYAFAERTP